jgi:hypothetical protein
MNIVFRKLQRIFNIAVWRYLPPCKEIVRTASDSLDRKLSLRERIVMKLHFWACLPCVRYFEQSKYIHGAMREFEENRAAELQQKGLSDDARARLKDLLKSSIGLFALFSIF